jgi:hypothetical protein
VLVEADTITGWKVRKIEYLKIKMILNLSKKSLTKNIKKQAGGQYK